MLPRPDEAVAVGLSDGHGKVQACEVGPVQRGSFQDDLQYVRPRQRRSVHLPWRAGLQHILQVEALLWVLLCTGALMQFLHSRLFHV